MFTHDFVEECPTVEEYQTLRSAVGWGEADTQATYISLHNSLYGVTLRSHEKIIGCGRVVGDGGLCFYIQDVIVLPAYQGQGLGCIIMDHIMLYVQAHACPGSFVGLMAAQGASGFYLKYGFIERPNSYYGPGMILFLS